MHSFNFKSEAKFLDPQQILTQYPCFVCQVESFGLFQQLQKYSAHAYQLSPQLSLLYLTLLQMHDTEHTTNAVIQKLSKRKQLSRVHPKSLFYFRLARKWVENLHLIEAYLKNLYLKGEKIEIRTAIWTNPLNSHLYKKREITLTADPND